MTINGQVPTWQPHDASGNYCTYSNVRIGLLGQSSAAAFAPRRHPGIVMLANHPYPHAERVRAARDILVKAGLTASNLTARSDAERFTQHPPGPAGVGDN